MLRRSTIVLAAALALQTVPTLASGPVVVKPVISTAPLTAADTVAALTHERMVAVTWTTGAPRVRVRWHQPLGWSRWSLAENDTGDSSEGTPGTEPLWRPAGADRVELQTTGTAKHLTLVRVSDGITHRLWGVAIARAATGRAVLGDVHPRSDWGADESLRRRAPSYAAKVLAVTVHHTANANGYSRADVPALIRADYAYHVQTRGWSDLGYNLVVDQYGGLWEGRAGGLGRATVGAHAQGFNAGTLGVALLGDMTQASATHEGEKALARVIGYAAATWGFDPAGTVDLTSQGSPRYASGQEVSLHRVFGHLETGITACPGSLEDRLPYLRHLATVAMGPAPQIVKVNLRGEPLHAPTPVILDAQLTLPASWTVDVTDPQGTSVVATASGTGTAPHLSWNGLTNFVPALPGTYTWTVKADDDFHDVVNLQGRFEVGFPLIRG